MKWKYNKFLQNVDLFLGYKIQYLYRKILFPYAEVSQNFTTFNTSLPETPTFYM